MFKPSERPRTLLGGNQERYLLAERSSLSSFFITVWYEVRGPLDLLRLTAAIAATISRHASLRTGFVHDAEAGFSPVVYPKARFDLHESEIADASHKAVAQACAGFLKKATDLSDPEALQRYALLRVGPDHAVLVFSQHHAVSDGRSLDIFVSEVAANYNGSAAPVEPDAEVIDYAADAGSITAACEYFRSRLEGTDTVPRLHRNLDGTHRQMLTERINLDPSIAGELGKAASASSVFSVLASVFAIQISAMTGLNDVIFSIQSSGRRWSDARIGSFSNALPIRLTIDPDESFLDLTSRMRALVREAVAHESLPYHLIQHETGVRPDFAINLYPPEPEISFSGVSVGARQFLTSDSDYALNLRWQRRKHSEEESYSGELYFDAGTVEQSRIAAFNQRHRELLAEALEDVARPVRQIASKRSELKAQSASSTTLPPRRIYEQVFEVARQHSSRVAISSPQDSITYAALVERVEARASALAAAGLTRNHVVAFFASRTPDLVITMLALSRLGAAFAAFDSDYPDARLLEQAESLQPDFVVGSSQSQSDRLAVFAEAGFRTAIIDAVDGTDAAATPPPAGPTDIAYFLFTSGTTGKPRAVGIGHSALPAFLDWERATLGIDLEDRVSLLSGLAHDPVMRDIFLPLTAGATLCIPDPSVLRDPRALTHWFRSTGVTVVHTTPPMGKLISDTANNAPTIPGVRVICWGGDLLPQKLVNLFGDANPGLRQFNFYGSTETPQAVASYGITPFDRDRRYVPIGRAIDHTHLSVVGKGGEMLSVGEVGQVVVETPYFARIIDQSGTSQVGQRYATGDLGYLLPEGDIQLIGRADDQVKVRGYRVELADVQQHICSLPEIDDALVLSGTGADGTTILVAHVRADDSNLEDFERHVMRQLARNMPAYMVPSRIFVHQRFPLLPNGKIDRAKLRGLELEHVTETPKAGRQGEEVWSSSERQIATVFEKVLGRAVSSPQECFADLGADSLSSIQAMLRLESLFSDLPEDWHELSITTLASKMQGRNGERRVLEQVRLVRVEPAVPIRAFAILAIMAFHSGVFSYGGGGPFLLFFLTGVAFSRFQLGTVLRGSTDLLEKALLKVMVFAVPIQILYAVKMYIADSPFWLANALLVPNLVDRSIRPMDSTGIHMWYIGCFWQIYVFLIAAFRIEAVRQVLHANLYRWIATAFIVFAALRFVLPALFREGGLHQIHPMSIWVYLPTAHMATMLLGVMVDRSREEGKRLALTLLLGLSYCLATYMYYPGNSIVLTASGVLLVALVASVRLPQVLARLAGVVSQASLIIYLLHLPIKNVLSALFDLPPVLTFLIAISVTTVIALLVDRAYIYIRDYLTKILSAVRRRNHPFGRPTA